MDSKEHISDDEVEEPTATPLWKYVTKISGETPNSKGLSGGSKFICNFGCKTEPYTGSYSRVRAHLIGLQPGQKAQGVQLCPNISKTERELLKQEEMEAIRIFGRNAKARKLPSNTSMKGGNQSNNPSPVKGILNKMFKISNKEDVDQRIARCLYGNGIPFNVVRSPLWADMVYAINNAPKGYTSPNYEKVRTTLLDKEQNKVRQALTPLMQDWSTHGVSIISDGWSNIKNQHLINIMAVSGGKAIFINGHDVSSMEQNATSIAELLFKAIDYVGPSNVVQVVTDNAANYKAAGTIIQRKYRHIFWSGCLAHTLNLLMKDIAKSEHPSLSFVDETYKRGKAVVKYIKNHSSCQFLFKSFSPLELLKSKKTRFGHHFIVIQRLVKVRASLVSMALSKQWESLRRTTSTPEQHDLIQQTVLDDDFWRKPERVLKITKPIYKMLRFSDTDQPIIGEVYEQMDTMLGTIKDVLSADPVVCELVPKLVVARWDKINIPLHCLAYVLVPKYYTNSWLSNPAPGGVKRRKPHVDSEVQQGYLEAIEKMVVDHKEAAVIRLQISDFVSNKGIFSQPQAIIDRATMTALSWWHLYGGVAPELFSLALKVLSQSVNTSCAERCWSTYSYIHTVKRNKLNVDRAEKLVFVHYNHRLLSRYRDDYEKFKNWDANPEEPNIEEDAATMEERERVSLSDSEDETVPISGQLTVVSSGSVPLCSTSSMLGSSSSPPPISQVSPIEQAKAQAQRRIEKARGKRQKK
ncbi:uncharacterized protein LOC130782121 [Actinidia eriantha]|uniref:uncharacterized protein LOC130782121 n=1 Tax=Actinidia eriantha TaxID=165200 RepID=UPI00258A98D9|nr:uncharacterized protein LOC130782121 [Actinidia eriantha]